MEGVSGRTGRIFSLFFVIILLVFLLPPAQAIIVTPQGLSLDEYASTQETIITFYNDQFEPVGCELTPSYLSTYLLPYVSLEPSRFILQPDEQQNVKITTTFPSDFPPQEHRLVIHAFRDSSETVTLSFRPPGEQRFSLLLEDAIAELTEDEETLMVTLQLRNNGNLVLFVRPQIIITKGGSVIKNMTYPQPVIVQPGETYPLTIRQDTGGFGTGVFEAGVQASYVADGTGATTPITMLSFVLTQGESSTDDRSWNGTMGIIIASFAVVMAALWFVPLPTRRRRRGKEKHITTSHHELILLRKDVDAARGDIAMLGKDIRLFVEEAEQWLQQQGGRA